MARPRKRRRVCCFPEANRFGPLNQLEDQQERVVMAVEEYETIRLIDLEGLTQEECAEEMQIARSTVQRIYSDARKKIAESLVNGKILRIEGGNYKICNKGRRPCGRGGCGGRRMRLENTVKQMDRMKNNH